MRVTNTILYAALATQTAQGFTLPPQQPKQQQQQQQRRPSTTSLSISGRGWDNDNFMNSLGGSDEDRNRANDDYFQKSRYGRPDGQDPLEEDEYNSPSVPLPPTDGDLPTGDIAGAELTEEMKQKMRERHNDPEEQASQGGKMFKKLLERAQQGPSREPPRPSAAIPPNFPPPPPPPAVYPGIPQPFADPSVAAAPTQVPQMPNMPADFNNLPVEEQARLFREMMAAQQQQQQQQLGAPNPYAQQQQQPGYYPLPAVPPPVAPPDTAGVNYLGPGVAPDGRKIGRNKDADAIVNSADLYFAQLKRDSTTRNYARYAGDDERANAVFHDPSIEQIKMHVNPYLQEQKQKEKQLYESVPDEIMLFQQYGQEQKKPKSYAGISYKEKMAQMKAKREGKPVPPSQRELEAQRAAEQEARENSADVPRPIPAVPEEYIAKFATPEDFVNARTETGPETSSLVETPMMSPPTPVVPQVAPPSPVPAPVAPPPPTATVTSSQPQQPPPPPQQQQQQQVSSPSMNPADVLTGDTRQDIRTLMGLMLKHRGGPGFGAGRLQGTEAEKLEALAKSIPDVLRQEESPMAATAAAAPFSNTAATTSSVSAQGGDQKVQTMITCIEGAVTMYKNSPAELQGSVLVALRAALLAALDTLSQAMQGSGVSPFPNPPSVETPTVPTSISPEQSAKIQSMIACIEGAIVMYKNSPIELQSSVLGTLSAALMSAVNTCNGILAVGSVKAPAVAPVMGEPYQEATSPEETTVVEQQYSGNDPNSIMLEEIYDRLKNAGGDGKMGIRSDLSSEEAKALQDSLTDMRTLLVDELHSGIPEEQAREEETAVTPPPPPSENSSSSTTSKYKQMLEKARAEKEGKDNFQ